MDQEQLAKATLAQIVQRSIESPHDSQAAYVGQIEFMRRQTQAVLDTAEYTRRSARYMLWSVVVLALSSVATFVVSILSWRWPK